ncbi:MAG: alpha-hydroxy-acid oxidizing protein [Thermoleophilaceae bacterium]|nr:alpha-hydroxy-acid oxidizing protein [Thermoleophilaceae bacterium]
MDTDRLNVADYERLAEQALEPGPYGYFAGGAGDERTLRDNVDAYGRWQLRPRMLVDVSGVSTATTVLGTPVSMPLLVAPTAFHKLCASEGEGATARAAAAAGTVMCLSTLATMAPAEVAAAAPEGRRWFQVYVFGDEGITRALVDQAIDCGFEALVLTVDAPGAAGRRERDLRRRFEIPAGTGVPSLDAAFGGRAVTVAEAFAAMDASLTWRDLERIAGMSELPLLVKGVLTAEDAALACEHGADGVIVSNHGGRQLDGVPATLDALPEVVEAVDDRFEVLVDGGIRRGTDVVKALALGARAAFIGRPVLWGLAAGGEEGVAGVLELFREELMLALRLLGAPTPQDVVRTHVQRAGS